MTDVPFGRHTHYIMWSSDVVHKLVLMFLQFSAAGVHLIQKSVTCGQRDSPAPVLLRATTATASWTNMDSYARSSPSLPASAKTEHCAAYWKKTQQPPIASQTVAAAHWRPPPNTVTFVSEFATLKYYCIFCNICKNDNFVNKFNTKKKLWGLLIGHLFDTDVPNCK